MTRPSTSEDIPKSFAKFQAVFLAVWCCCVAADWLQGPYVYALYSAYGFSKSNIAQLFVAGFGSSLVFSCIVGSLADRFGRKRSCLAYCVLYILSCMTKHFNDYWILMLGRITGGAATSLLFSVFECWMVSEHTTRHRFSGGLLSYLFGNMFMSMYLVAILSGLVAQFAVDSTKLAPVRQGGIFHVGGTVVPFDLSIGCLIVGMGLITALWDENYGSVEDSKTAAQQGMTGLWEHVKLATSSLSSNMNLMMLALVVSCFEGSMYAFVFNWTPALEDKANPPPLGIIFALFMMACMCGSSAATLVAKQTRSITRLVVLTFLFATAFGIASMSLGFSKLCFLTFLAIEFCVGAYFPAVGVLKSEIVPEEIRGTLYNLYRIPLNLIVVLLLLTNLSMASCFRLCAVLGLVAFLSIVQISRTSQPLALANAKAEGYQSCEKVQGDVYEISSKEV